MWNSILQKQLDAAVDECSRKFFFLTWAFTIYSFCGCFSFSLCFCISVFTAKILSLELLSLELLNAWSLPKVNEQEIVEIAFKFYNLLIGGVIPSQLCSKAAECYCRIQYLLLLYATQTEMNLNILRHMILSRHMNTEVRYFPINRIQQWIKHNAFGGWDTCFYRKQWVLSFISEGWVHALLVNSGPNV